MEKIKQKDLEINCVYAMNIHPSGVKYTGRCGVLNMFIDMETGKFVVLKDNQLGLLKGKL